MKKNKPIFSECSVSLLKHSSLNPLVPSELRLKLICGGLGLNTEVSVIKWKKNPQNPQTVEVSGLTQDKRTVVIQGEYDDNSKIKYSCTVISDPTKKIETKPNKKPESKISLKQHFSKLWDKVREQFPSRRKEKVALS